jgi:hypothetical protein
LFYLTSQGGGVHERGVRRAGRDGAGAGGGRAGAFHAGDVHRVGGRALQRRDRVRQPRPAPRRGLRRHPRHREAHSAEARNSRETKYRWRESQRACPACGQAAIIKGKEDFGGGWLCWKKKGGCGAKYPDGDQSIESQQTGRVFNPDIADQVNTIQKMSQKRSLVGAVLLAVNASEFFTQDVEDMHLNATAVAREVGADLDEEIRAACRALGKMEEQLAGWLRKKYGADGVAQLTEAGRREVLALLRGMLSKRAA